ncbi:MAG: hypothetical protein M1816_000641 [Peltula sp. TS41687]|nr:MAG: hypothetical protein M1816_000641 [Peltula sp. TS41687]
MAKPHTPLSMHLPPLILGTATFTTQYNPDPYALPTTEIIHRALALGVRAFDTSPYYGPAEELLGRAFDTPCVRERFPRSDYYLLTKVGRISSSEFDYSSSWIRASVRRSLERLRTSYIDVVYCHDVEFVSSQEVLSAVTELRRIRDETGTLRHVGISGYPVGLLCELAELVLRETGEPLDAVMSYANFTLQNTTLATMGIARLRAAGVDVVPNASPLGMGLLRRNGVPIGSQGDFHPAPDGLRDACQRASEFCEKRGEKLEIVAIRFALENWGFEGADVGTVADGFSDSVWNLKHIRNGSIKKFGVSVIGVSSTAELEETMRVWSSILHGLDGCEQSLTAITPDAKDSHREWSLRRRKRVQDLSVGIRAVLGRWVDFSWPSPGPNYARVKRSPDHNGLSHPASADRVSPL